MAKKSAIVLDTNFIIEHISDLHKLHEKLFESNDVYVADISINERISQKYINLKSIYEKIEKFKREYSAYVTIKLKDTFDKRFEMDKQRTLDVYNKEFGNFIIRFCPDEETLKIVMDRVYKKIAPFVNKENASDKGFKDTLIWMSILQYFKELKEDIDVVFITNDNGFLNSIEALQAEFVEVTGKTIEIKDNNYYKILLGDESPPMVKEEEVIHKLLDIDKQAIRDRIEYTIDDICSIDTYDYWGHEQMERTFTTNEKFDVDYIKIMFRSLGINLENHIFESQISAYSILSHDDRIKDINPIPMQALDAAYELYEEILNKYPKFIEPFFNAVCEIMNRNFVAEYISQYSEDDEVPF